MKYIKFKYENKELEAYINQLENKYIIENAQDKYNSLVNFSKNSKVPFHQWFKYREGFAGALIEELIDMSGAQEGEVIIDPFCGSGTTNVVAALSGYSTLGLDINPMSAYITNVKISSYTEDELRSAVTHKNSIKNFEIKETTDKYADIKKYFNSKNFYELYKIKEYIDLVENDACKEILMTAFISIIIPCSNRKRDGNGLKTVETKISDVYGEFSQKLDLIVEDIRKNGRKTDYPGVGIYGTAFSLKELCDKHMSNRAVGAIIFSPPYANSFDYFESYKLELIFGGFVENIKGLASLRKKAVRSFIGGQKASLFDYYVDLLAKEIMNKIPQKEKETKKKDSRTRKVPDMLKGYFADMQEVIKQCSLCLDSGKKTYIVVDQSSYLGIVVPTDLFFAAYAEQFGFKVCKIIECRKARTSTQQLNKYPYLKSLLRESIIELEKI